MIKLLGLARLGTLGIHLRVKTLRSSRTGLYPHRHRFLGTTSEWRGNALNGFKDLNLKAKAILWR